MNEQTRKAVVGALRALADALESDVTTQPATTVAAGARYYTRRTWTASGGEGREFDRAVGELRSFKAGRRRLVLCDEMHAWIETHVRPARTRESENREDRQGCFDGSPQVGLSPLRSAPDPDINAAINHAFGEGLPVPREILDRLMRIAKKDGEKCRRKLFRPDDGNDQTTLAGLAPNKKPPSADDIEKYRQMCADEVALRDRPYARCTKCGKTCKATVSETPVKHKCAKP